MFSLVFASVVASGWGSPISEIAKLNVSWDTPSKNAAGSMPIGGGELGMNVWAEENGDLILLLSRTDAWSESSRLMKLCRVRLHVEPNPFASGRPFKQELHLEQGRIEVRAGDCQFWIWADSSLPDAYVTLKSKSPVKFEASLESWRTANRQIKDQELGSSWTMQNSPIPVFESADAAGVWESGVFLYHQNASSCVPLSIQHQGLQQEADRVQDTIAGRLFGVRMASKQMSPTGSKKTAAVISNTISGAGRDFSVHFSSDSSQPKSVEAWLLALMKRKNEPEASAKRTQGWWKEFWNRSYVFVEAKSQLQIPDNDQKLRFAHDSNGENKFVGQIGRASYIPRVLTQQEIQNAASSQGSLRIKEAIQYPPSMVHDQTEHIHGAEPEKIVAKNGFSVEAWVKPEAPVGRIIDHLTAGQADGFLFDTHPGYAIRLIVGSETVIVPNALKKGEWTHVAATVDPAAGVRIYKAGKLVHEQGTGNLGQEITQAYNLQRYMLAIGGRGNYPIKFNGSIFTVEPSAMGLNFDPDWRRWGDCFWWQNTRLPYAPMVAAGDLEMMKPLFKMFKDVLPICTARAKLYYDAKGAYFPETMTNFGLYANNDYGWDRTGHKASEVQSPWWQWAWNQGPELLMLMLDYYEASPNPSFLKNDLLPMAGSVLDYFDSRFARVDGRLKITPTQAVETYWKDVVNDTPSVAGLHAVVQRLRQRGYAPAGWSLEKLKRFESELPPVPVVNGRLMAAESFNPERSNVENPELYAIWPFRLYGVGKPNLDVAAKSFKNRIERANAGWQYDGQIAALCGLTDDAAAALASKVRNSNPSYRWPATWGPNYDWLPDQCHGGNIMVTLQMMLMQADDGKVQLLPAWPKDWNVKAKLWSTDRTWVEFEYRDGQMVRTKSQRQPSQ